MIQIKVTKEERRENILEVAIKLAEKVGYKNVRAVELAEMIGCSHVLVLQHFGTMDNLREEIMIRAIQDENAEIVLQGLVCRDVFAIGAPPELKQRAKSILNYEA